MKNIILITLSILTVLVIADTNKPIQDGPNPFQCMQCKVMVQVLESWMANNEPALDQRFDKFCDTLGKDFISLCDAFVNFTVDEAVKYIETNEKPEQLCVLIGQCASVDESMPEPMPIEVTPVMGNDLECAACKFIVGKIKQWVASNATEEEIVKELEQACAWIKSDVCKVIVEGYLGQIIKMLEDQISSAEICQEITMCPMKGMSPVSPSILNTPIEDNGLECAGCEFLVGKIEQWVASGSTEAQIIAEIQNVCTWIDSDICNQIIQNFLPQIIQWLEQQETPATICQQISMCDSSFKQFAKSLFMAHRIRHELKHQGGEHEHHHNHHHGGHGPHHN